MTETRKRGRERAVWRAAAALAGRSPRLALLLAGRMARRGDRRGARDLLLRVADRDRGPADLMLARLHQELGEPLAALASARAVLARRPDDLAAAEIAIRCAHRLESEAEVTALIETVTRAAGLAAPRDGAATARLLLAAERSEEALAAALAAPKSPARASILFDAAYAAGDFSAAAAAAARLAAVAPLKPRQARMAQEVARARAIVPGGQRFPQALFEAALSRPAERAPEPTDTIVLATSTLANAGAERQVAITARLVAEARRTTPGARTLLLVRSLDPGRGHAARLPLARSPGLEIEDLSGTPVDAIRRALAGNGIPASTLALIAAFPQRLSEDILRLFARFHTLRPRAVHLWQDGTIAVGGVAAVLAGVPRIVAGLRNVPPDAGDRRRAAPWLLPMYRALAARDEVRFVANSRAGARDYAAWIGLPPERIAVVHNGIDGAALRQAAAATGRSAIRTQVGVPESAPLIGGAFRLARHKRPELWLRTAALVAGRMPEARFLILGGGVMRDAMSALATELGLGEKLVFAGARDPVEPWLAALDLFLLCSAQEGLPNALIEAQALGVPAVITPAGGAAEAIEDGRTGLLVGSAQADDLATAVVTLIADEPRRAEMANAAPEMIAARFGLDRMLAETLESYGTGLPPWKAGAPLP